jgi:hypothetical protein
MSARAFFLIENTICLFYALLMPYRILSQRCVSTKLSLVQKNEQ